MLKKTIAFTDVDGNAATETHYFNLTTADLIKMQMREGEGFQDYLNRIIESGDGQAIIDTFEKILRLAYGVRSADGKFTKPAGAFDEFMASEAYSELFMELVTNAQKSAEFIRGVVPSDLAAKVEQAQNTVGISQNLQEHLDLPAVVPDESAKVEDRVLRPRSKAELLRAYKEKNDALMKPHPYKDMPVEKAMGLSPAEFQIWLELNA
jgi:hypothetical protein